VINVEPLSIQVKRARRSFLNYDYMKAKFVADTNEGDGLLVMAARVRTAPGSIDEEVIPDFFRIHFGPPPTLQGLPPELFPGVSPPDGSLPNGGESFGAQAFRNVHHFHFLHWIDSTLGQHAVFRDQGYDYESSGKGFGFANALYSPNRDFLVLVVADNNRDCAAYLEFFRRRDHRLLAKIRVDSCFDVSFVLESFGWVTERDFVLVSGTHSSDCVVCRLEK